MLEMMMNLDLGGLKSWQRYLISLLAIAAAVSVRSEFLGILGTDIPFVSFFTAVMIVALCSGFLAGILATVFSAAYISYWFEPVGQLFYIRRPSDRVGMAVFIMSCIILSYLIKMLREAQAKAVEAEAQAILAEQRRVSEEKIRALNAGLEKRVAERTAELEEVVREQAAFSYSVSHDLRAPLRHINSFSAMLLADYGASLPARANDYLERIGAASSKMGELIDALLDLSRLNRTALVREDVDLSELASVVAVMLQKTDPQRSVEFLIEEGLRVQGDRDLLMYLLQNLLGNAWKYSCGSTPARIEFGKTGTAETEAFFVKDNGTGFDMKYKGKLFEVFHRLHGAEFEGTGIGLAIALRIVKRHGGTIWAESQLGEGATFYFTLP